ncbi:glycosyltransferase family protein [Fulvivirga ulvae]|uniref:glycosyltransferase family protein n=1 Tax=Fulvivirga ulvae TaxID=2904245 RepID=UPI001F163049|nr:glycosyltransferase family protein [Fulvivirga ulvae]UII30191.1 glycosyltransferase family protein [Fulvivirga ulvae]
MKIGAIVQARMSSSRLPGKVMKELPFNSGIPSIEQVLRRVSAAEKIDEVILATSDDESDDELASLVESRGYHVYRGSLGNVLERYYLAATKYSLDIVVRITGDCPCIDPDVIDMVVDRHILNHADFTSSAIVRTFPIGIDVGVMNYTALTKAFDNAQHDYEREHVTPYFYKTKPDEFNVQVVKAEENRIHPEIRLTLDTPEDYNLLCCVFDYLYQENNLFGVDQAITLFEQKPWLKNINEKVSQKRVHNNLEGEVEDVLQYCEHQGLNRMSEYIKNNLL